MRYPLDARRLDTCRPLMETQHVALVGGWRDWADLGSSEISPVIDSADAVERVHGAYA